MWLGGLPAVGSVEETDAMTAAFRMDRPITARRR